MKTAWVTYVELTGQILEKGYGSGSAADSQLVDPGIGTLVIAPEDFASVDREAQYVDGTALGARVDGTLEVDRVAAIPMEDIEFTTSPGAWIDINGVLYQADGEGLASVQLEAGVYTAQLTGDRASDRITIVVREIEAWDTVLFAKVDAEAGAFRQRFITDVPGQQLTYARKETEARAWAAENEPEIANYPFLAAEVAATGLSAGDAAAAIIAAADEWAQIGSAIEGARILAKQMIGAATLAQDKADAAAVDWEALYAD